MRRLGLICLILLVASCGKKTRRDYARAFDSGEPVRGGVLVEADSGSPSKLNPILYGDAVSGALCDLIFNGLVRLNPELKLEGDLAESWSYAQGGRRLTFRLRRGVRWHDGHPFTSNDVRFTWMKIMDPKVATPRKGDFELVSDVLTPDPHTVVVLYKKPFAPALEAWALGMIPEHLLKDEKDLNTCAFNRNPVGTGPFRFKEWVDKQHVKLVANDDYYEGRPHLDAYTLRFIPEQSTQLLEFKAESLDRVGLTPDQFKLETDGADFRRIARKYRVEGWHRYFYMGFNLRKELFQDRRVRWALSYAIDREMLVQGVLQGYGKPCSGPYAPVMEAYDPEVTPVPYDPDQAARLLEEAGWKAGKDGWRFKNGKPLAFRLLASQGSDTTKKIVLILQQQFAKVGARAEVEMYEWSTFISNYINKRNFDAAVLGWQLSTDPDLYSIWHSSQTGEEEFNFVSYRNLEVDRLLEQGRSEMDPRRRIRIYRRVHRLIAQDQPYCFLFAPDSLSALNLRVRGVREHKTGYSWYWTRDWYIPTSLQP